MPRFFFHVRSSVDFIRDQEGTILPDIGHARREAEIDARHLLAEAVRKGEVVDERAFEVADVAGKVLFVFPLRNALKLA